MYIYIHTHIYKVLKNINFVQFFHVFGWFSFGDDTWWCLGPIPGSMFRENSWEVLGDHLGWHGSNHGQWHIRQIPYLL